MLVTLFLGDPLPTTNGGLSAWRSLVRSLVPVSAFGQLSNTGSSSACKHKRTRRPRWIVVNWWVLYHKDYDFYTLSFGPSKVSSSFVTDGVTETKFRGSLTALRNHFMPFYVLYSCQELASKYQIQQLNNFHPFCNYELQLVDQGFGIVTDRGCTHKSD